MSNRILAVDDEPKWLAFAQQDLGSEFEVEVTTDLETTLELLADNYYDLIITSSRKLDVLKAIHETHPQERVVVSTGQPTTGEAIKSYRLGALDYFAKDFRVNVMCKKIRETLNKPVILII